MLFCGLMLQYLEHLTEIYLLELVSMCSLMENVLYVEIAGLLIICANPTNLQMSFTS